jgi:hypothetical protein
MPEYEFIVEEHPGYVHAMVRGDRTEGNTLRALKEMGEACRRLNRYEVLLELAFTGPSLDMTSILRVISERSASGTRLRKLAYFESSPDKPGRAAFAETVAVNRGVNVRHFTGREAAIRWLLESPIPDAE